MEGANRSLQKLLYHRCETERGGGKKENPTQKQPPCKLRQHKGPVAGAEPGGWAGARSTASPPRPARRAQRAGSCPCSPRGRDRVPAGTQGASLARPGLPRPLHAPAPAATPSPAGLRLRLCPGARSAAAAALRAEAGPVLTCAPSAKQSAESGGARARHPRGGPCSGGGPLQSGLPVGGRFALLLFIRPQLQPGIGRQGRRTRPVSSGTDTRCAPRPAPLGDCAGDGAAGRVVLRPRAGHFPRPPAPLPFLVIWASATALPQSLRRSDQVAFELEEPECLWPLLGQGAQVGGCSRSLVETAWLSRVPKLYPIK